MTHPVLNEWQRDSHLLNEYIQFLIRNKDVDVAFDKMGYGEGDIEGLVSAVVKDCIRITISTLIQENDEFHNTNKEGLTVQDMVQRSIAYNRAAKEMRERYHFDAALFGKDMENNDA